jgi:hypothetical protein
MLRTGKTTERLQRVFMLGVLSNSKSVMWCHSAIIREFHGEMAFIFL